MSQHLGMGESFPLFLMNFAKREKIERELRDCTTAMLELELAA